MILLDDTYKLPGDDTITEADAAKANALFNEVMQKRIGLGLDSPIVTVFSRVHCQDKPTEQK